eukprot:CAMPEP_0205935924 /NCGR_PEP_ID=MMETSP1325-20131115/40233_1 /ASSEMBLY_ACC=CAM_ASM_000708 /TAXON_ID=236786 /ORGANISM="Florenciella sp., Strain RCC1007" /LENGTH=50 /DNA_ID=CAMNT_0053306039 /DNA_START=85 /DNA_END=237 /DNA_ORIENTATION=+
MIGLVDISPLAVVRNSGVHGPVQDRTPIVALGIMAVVVVARAVIPVVVVA